MKHQNSCIRTALALSFALTASVVLVEEVPAPPILPGVCTVSTAGMAFGTYTPKQSGNLDATAYVSIVCSAGIPFLLGMDNGMNFQSPWRRGRNGSNYLNYQFYLDSGRSQVWGMTPGSSMLAGTGTGSLQNIQVYGRIPALQQPIDGNYSDTVTVTVEYTP